MSMEFIEMISELHEERFNKHLEQLVEEKTPCGIFFGFELIPSNAASNVQNLQNVPLNISCAIVLADVQAAALQPLVNVPVITLEDFSRFGEENFPVKPQEVLLPDILKDAAFADYFKQHGIKVLAPIFLDAGETFFFTMKYLPVFYKVHEMLASDESKKVFRAVIKGRLTGNLDDYRYATEPQYFLEGFTPTAGDIAIDGGAYDGATSLSFAKCGAKVFAFEMDATNYKNCQARLANNEYDITLENLGLSDKAGVENYFPLNTSSTKNSKGTLTAKFIDLDTYVAEKNLPRVDYIKLDIEGAELDMLKGAAETIRRCKPKMAISAYHRVGDLMTLPLFIKSLRDDYEFEFRHYKIDCTDYILDDNERAILDYFGLSYMVPASCEYLFYCR